MAIPLPMKRPVPIAPPMPIMVICRWLSAFSEAGFPVCCRCDFHLKTPISRCRTRAKRVDRNVWISQAKAWRAGLRSNRASAHPAKSASRGLAYRPRHRSRSGPAFPGLCGSICAGQHRHHTAAACFVGAWRMQRVTLGVEHLRSGAAQAQVAARADHRPRRTTATQDPARRRHERQERRRAGIEPAGFRRQRKTRDIPVEWVRLTEPAGHLR